MSLFNPEPEKQQSLRDRFENAALPAVLSILELVRKLGRHYDFEDVQLAISILATKAPGAEELFKGLCHYLGSDTIGHGEASGRASTIFMNALSDTSSAEVRAWIRSELDALENDAEHPYRVNDVHQIYSMIRLQSKERLSLSQIEGLLKTPSHPGLGHHFTTLSIELEEAVREGDAEYAECELRRFTGPLLQLLGTQGREPYLQINRTSAFGVFETLFGREEFAPVLAKVVIEETEKEMLQNPGNMEDVHNGLLVVRQRLGDEFDGAVKTALETSRVNAILTMILTRALPKASEPA